jgi:mannose-1-phosphate guanylyltransferase
VVASGAPVNVADMSAHAVILAGGRGTRFWPRSRTRTPKQLLNIVGRQTMLEQTVERLTPIFPSSRLWVVTNDEQSAAVRKQLPRVVPAHVLAEPIGRNTAAAIGLAAVHLLREPEGDALMAVLPADHFIAQAARYRKIVRAALNVAAHPDALVVLGIPPTRPETGYGYIERAQEAKRATGASVYGVKRFTEKPALALARKYVASKRYFWNAGMFFWRVSTLLRNLERHLPKTHAALLHLADSIGTPHYAATLRRTYPQLENISIDYAVLEPASRNPKRSPVFVLPASVGWSDIGSWAAVYELLAGQAGENISAGRHLALDAAGNFLWSPGKFVAAIGVRDLVVVETPDALLVCPRDRAQDVGRVVKWLEEHRLSDLL